jgi:hypothetical protein
VLTPFWESATVPGIFFAGNVTQAAPGLRKHGVASLSSMVCGFRYNARILARHVAEAVFGRRVERPSVDSGRVVPYLLDELNRAPELTMQKGYLARVLSVDERDGIRDQGILPLEVFVDGSHDGVAVTLEFDPDETIRPVVYTRRGGTLRETALDPHPLRRYDDAVYADDLELLMRPLLGT